MSVVVSVEDSGPCRKQVVVEVPAPAVDAEQQRLLGEFGRAVSIPGFRKGKVPRSLIAQRFKKEIREELLERLLPRYWRQAEAESGLDPLLPPEVDEVNVEDGEPLTFKATVEVRPDFPLNGLDSLSVPNPPVEPDEQEVQDALDELRGRHGDWAPVERSAGQGDLVTLEIRQEPVDEDSKAGEGEGGEAGEKEEAAAASSPEDPQTLSVEVGDPRIWEELSVAVTGLSAGQKGSFTRRMGEGEDASERTFTFEVQAVKEKELPELDDEFAGAVGEFEDLAALKEEVTSHIRQSKTRARQQERETTLLDQLRELHPIELPERVVQKEVEELLHRHAERLAMQGVDLNQAEIDWAALMEQARPEAQKRVHARLILDAVVAEKEIQVREQDFEQALSEIARAQGSSPLSVRQALDQSGRLGALKAQLRRDRAVRMLLGEDEAGEETVTEKGAGGESAEEE